MDNFKVIYKVLKFLEESMDLEHVNPEVISHDKLGISETRWTRLILLMLEEGYIDGVHVIKSVGSTFPGLKFVDLRITLTGLEYLEENSSMKKIKNRFKEIKEIVPGM